MRKYKLIENFFENIDSEEKAYFLGFLFADGYINEKLNFVDLTIHQQDKEILEKFILLLYPESRPLKTIRNKYIRLIINSKKIVNDLKFHGCFQKKTFLIKFPTTIPENQIRHFIRGYFDGDGCIYNVKGSLTISIVGTIDMLDKLRDFLKINCNLNDTKYDIRHPERNNNIRSLVFGGNIIVNRIYHYFYDESTIYLDRKKNKFLDILKEKRYFCDKDFSRKSHKKYYEYENKIYNKTELSKILSKKTDILKTTIRRKLQNDWTIDEILQIPLNNRRNSKKKTVCKFDKNNKIVETYESVSIAAKENNCHEGSIYQAILKNKQLYKYYWKYYE